MSIHFLGGNMVYDPYKAEREQDEQDAADDVLQNIVVCKRELKYAFDVMVRRFPELRVAIASDMALAEDAFDDRFFRKWSEAVEKGSATWPTRIPAFEVLSFETPKQKADRDFAKRSNNPATLVSINKLKG
jgi:hypothetical protein